MRQVIRPVTVRRYCPRRPERHCLPFRELRASACPRQARSARQQARNRESWKPSDGKWLNKCHRSSISPFIDAFSTAACNGK